MSRAALPPTGQGQGDPMGMSAQDSRSDSEMKGIYSPSPHESLCPLAQVAKTGRGEGQMGSKIGVRCLQIDRLT